MDARSAWLEVLESGHEDVWAKRWGTGPSVVVGREQLED
jgi:hypothetical protein